MADKQRQSMQDHYEMIKRARAILAATPKSEVSESTAADYLRKVRRLRARGRHHGGGLFDGAISEALKTTKKSSWQASRAALLHCARAGLEGYLTQQDQVQRACRAADLLGQPAQWDLWKLLAARKISVIVLQLGKLDLASAAGKMMLTMLAAVAEMERDLLVERTQSGLARAKSEGKTLGRPSKTTADQRAEIVAKHAQGESVSALARLHAVSRASILSIVNQPLA
jgi:hypothetical protein